MTVGESQIMRFSRRDILIGSAAAACGGIFGVSGLVGATTDAARGAETPPLPWKWVTLDPDQAGRRAYRLYFDQGGCGTASYLSILSLLKEKAGYPWTVMPDMMMIHAASGYGGHGTLCGALGGASCIINLVAYSPEKDAFYKAMIDWLYGWYAQQDFPGGRFDDISKMPGQIRVKAKSPLCHTSVSTWALAAGEQVTSDAKKERCAKVSGEVVYTVVDRLNEHFAGRWSPAAWEPSEEYGHCVKCHGPDNVLYEKTGMNAQQGHMDCLICHSDHTR